MKKLLLLITALLTLGVSGAWATDVKIAETSSGLPTAAGFGSFSGQTFTTADGSGLAGVTVTASTGLSIGQTSVSTEAAGYGNCFSLTTAAASTNYTVTLTAPEGYIITGYYMGCSANSDGKRHTITPAGWASGVVVTSPPYNNPVGPKVIEVTGLNTNSTSFTISTANAGNPLYLPTFTIYVAKPAPVTYVISDASGVVFTSDAIIAGVGTTITTLPASLQRDYCNYTVPSTVVAEEGNTINVTVDYALPFTSSTSFSDAVWYYATLRGKYLRADDDVKDGNGRYSTNTENEHTDAYKWAFFGNPYTYIYIVNKNQGEGKYLYAGTNPEFQAIANPTADNKALWVPSVNGAGFTLRSVSGASLYINDAGNGGNLGYWNSSLGATDAGSRWVVEEAPASEVNVTYNVVIGGNVVATASEMQGVGAAPAVPASLNFAYTSYTYDIDVIPGSATTVTATPAFNMPFTVSTDYATATWYYLHGHASYSDSYVSTSYSGTEVVWSAGKGITERFQWAFIGNPIQGIKIINKAAGATNFLQETNPLTMATTDKSWTIKQQTNTSWQSGANGFGLWSEVYSQYVNTQSSTLKYYGYFDQGSTFWCELVPDNYASNVEAEIKPWFDNYGDNFELKTAVVDANQTKYEAALVNCDLATYQELTALVADANNYMYPETGFYRIKSSGVRIGESYIAYGQPSSASAGLITVPAANAATDASTIIRLTGSNGQYTISTQGLYAQNQTTNNVAFPMTADAASAATFSFIPYAPGKAVITNDFANQGYFHESGWAVPAVVRWTASADASSWTVEAAETLTIPLNVVGGKSYATMCLPFDVTLADGTDAYTVAISGERAALTKQNVTKKPAGAAVLLVNESGAESVVATITSDAAALEGTNALTGTYVEKSSLAANEYIFGTKSGELGFWKMKDGSKVGANKAYLVYDGAADVKGFSLDFSELTGINEIAGSNTQEKAIFDLSGRRIQEPTRGLYIVNGKKVIVK